LVAWSDVTEVLNAIDLSMERMTPSPDLLKTYNKRRESINVKIQLQRSREIKIEHDGLQAALRFWPPKYISSPLVVLDVRADDRSIPSIVGTTKQNDLDDIVDVPNMDTVPDFNHLGQNPISNSNPSYSSSAGLSAQNEFASLWQVPIDAPSGNASGSEDQSFWDLINGGTVEDLDFSAFLQNFNGDGSAI